jgi:hypothetical protein
MMIHVNDQHQAHYRVIGERFGRMEAALADQA